MPVWFRLIREDIASFRTETNQRLDKLVTQDAFEAEKRRTDDRFAALGKDVVDNREEANGAITALGTDLKAKTLRDQDREDEARRFKAGQVIAIVLGVAAIVASFIMPFIHGGA
ncbi:hypothetical protein [Curtobacterium sp. 9128]|uniref:hypothetical protein n=1 Tax=Curtobacterium sp. 9128 TaxID=1793722 RepID=UPI002481C688|nr:hypothetical protein [Curtobacterium sp. 9128]